MCLCVGVGEKCKALDWARTWQAKRGPATPFVVLFVKGQHTRPPTFSPLSPSPWPSGGTSASKR